MEEKSILDCTYKTCTACGRRFTLRNYRMLERAEFGNELITISEKFSKVCKCCEKHPEMQLKANRLERLRAVRKKAEAKAAIREHEEIRQRFNREKPIKVKRHKKWKTPYQDEIDETCQEI